jgi:hypothetical protein
MRKVRKESQQSDLNTPLTTAPANTDRKQGTNLKPLCDKNQFPAPEPAKVERVVEPSSRKSTGPRTPQGKQRSRYNALKHGIFSRKLLLRNESRAEYESLLKGMYEDVKPEGTLAMEIFMDMVFNRWNKRRLHRGLNAEIAENVEYSEFDRSAAQQAQDWASEQCGGALGGMLTPGCNHFVLRKGIEILNQIRGSVEARGISLEIDYDLLKKLYGTDTDGKVQSGVFHCYLQAAACASVPQEGKQNLNPDELKKNMIEVLDEEIRNQTALENAVLDIDRMRSKYRVDRALVPSQRILNLYMRYDTHLDRQFYRDLIVLASRKTR